MRASEQRLFERILADRRLHVIKCVAQDFQMSSLAHSGWVQATPQTTQFLNRNVKEVEVIHFFEGAVYEMTYNDKGNFSQSQIAVLAEMPTAEDVRSFRDVKLIIAPEGCKTVPEDYRNVALLQQWGWKPGTIGLSPERVQTVRSKGLKAKRQQYGMKHRIASTVHACMGSEMDKLVTCISKVNKQYSLWEKEQAVVVLSRTDYAKDLILVGDKEDTLDALVELIQIRSQFAEYMAHLLQQLCTSFTSRSHFDFPIIDYGNHPFRPIDVPMPQDSSGFCYILVSMANFTTTYIGQTLYLVKRLKQHNSGHGSRGTADPRLRPWALLGFVSGFEGDKNILLSFERLWKERRDTVIARNGVLSAGQIADLGIDVIASLGALWRGVDLRYVRCATLHHTGIDE